MKRGSAIVLAVSVLVVTVLSLLHIWGVLDITGLLSKAVQSLIVIFVASAVLLFIFAVFFKPDNPGPRGRQVPPGGQ